MAEEKGIVYNERRKFGLEQQFVPSDEEEDFTKEGVNKGQIELSAQEAKRRRRLERDPLHQGLIEERAPLRNRDYDLDLMDKVGKTQVITLTAPLSQQAGFYCQVCDCILRDSQSYLDHINGKWHNRALGMSMRVERVSVDRVKKRLEMHRRKKDKDGMEDYVPDGFETLKEDESRRNHERDRKRVKFDTDESQHDNEEKSKKKKEKEGSDKEEEENDEEMMASMGFASFGGAVKK